MMVSILRKFAPKPLPSIHAKYFPDNPALASFYDGQVDEATERKQITALERAYRRIEWEALLAERAENGDRYRIMAKHVLTGEIEVVDFDDSITDANESLEWYGRYWGDGYEFWYDDTKSVEGN